MFYLFLGDDYTSKDFRISALRSKYLTVQDAVNFDLEGLDAKSFDPAELKKALVTLPVVSSKRVIIIRNIEKAKQQNQDIILDFLEKKENYHVIICDSAQDAVDNAFGKKLESLCQVVRCVVPKEDLNVFAVTDAIKARNAAKALETLHKLFDQGESPLRMMGGFISSWGRLNGRISVEKFSNGLQVLQDTDINIKRSRLAPEAAMEVAVVKLTELLK